MEKTIVFLFAVTCSSVAISLDPDYDVDYDSNFDTEEDLSDEVDIIGEKYPYSYQPLVEVTQPSYPSDDHKYLFEPVLYESATIQAAYKQLSNGVPSNIKVKNPTHRWTYIDFARELIR